MTAGAPALPRQLPTALIAVYGVGVMVGAGIYVLVGAVADGAGVWAPAAFLAAGLIVSLPTVVLFLITQRAFSRGLALGQF